MDENVWENLPRPPRFHDADMRSLDQQVSSVEKPSRFDVLIGVAFMAGILAAGAVIGYRAGIRAGRFGL